MFKLLFVGLAAWVGSDIYHKQPENKIITLLTWGSIIMFGYKLLKK